MTANLHSDKELAQRSRIGINLTKRSQGNRNQLTYKDKNLKSKNNGFGQFIKQKQNKIEKNKTSLSQQE